MFKIIDVKEVIGVLKFIYGLPSSGKTYTILQKIKEISALGQETVLIVPEQSSFEAEKLVLQEMGDTSALKVNVLSFSRLQEEVCRIIGGGCAKVLSDADKIIFMNKALNQVSSQLKLWGKYAHSVTFAKTVLDTIGELKINCVSVDDIKNAASETDMPSLKAKLENIALIYETYDYLTAERYIDPADKLTRLYASLIDFHYFKDKTVFIDGFGGFTGQQFKIIDRILAQSNEVYIAFTNDVSLTQEFNVFTNIRNDALRIEKIAKSHNVAISEPILLNTTHYNNISLSYLERLICGGEITDSNSTDFVTVCEAATVFDEAEFAARTVRQLVRNNKYRYRDFVIVARDTERYAEAIDYACRKNSIPYFYDKKIPLSAFPLAVATDAAINSLSFSTENILRFHKSGFSVLTNDEISLLENYTYLWNINGDMWLSNWDMDVRGFVTDEPTEHSVAELEKVNNIRQKAIKPIIEFKNNFNGNAKSLSSAIVKLFENCDAKNSLKAMCDRFNDEDNIFSSDVLKQSYEAYMRILDCLVNCFGEKTLKIKEFYEALTLAVSLESVGIIPQTLDEVVFGSADRIKPSRPRVAIILGANQGIFPLYKQNSGVFAINERKKLLELGIEIADNSIYTSIDENYLVYCNLCCASDRVYITYSEQTLKGEITEPSSFVQTIKAQLKPTVIKEPVPYLNTANLPETEAAAFSDFCRRLNNHNDALSIKTAIGENSRIDNLLSATTLNDKQISTENAKALYGKNINLSATKLDTLNRCKFSFFCKYGLRAQKLQPADFDVLQRGTIVHFVLEKIISEYKENIKNLSRSETDLLCDKYINEYLNLVTGYKTIQNAKHEFLISKISRSLKEVVWHLAEEFAQSDFVPSACELAIGGKDGIPLKFDYDEGEIFVNGSIDRVDEYNGYIRIIDYKTGTKSFKLPDILFGLNLQMLIYLYAVIRADNREDSQAAGIFYMPSKRDINNDGMAMNGLIKADTDLVHAMDKENKGEFVPSLPINKDGSISKTATSYILEENFTEIFDYIEKLMKKAGNTIISGDIDVYPVDGRESAACAYCDYKSVCGIENKAVFKVPNLKNTEVFELMKEGEEIGI